MQSWSSFGAGLGQYAIKSAVDMKLAGAAMDDGLMIPESNLYSALPASTSQPTYTSTTPAGIPFRVVNPNGQLNWPVVGALGAAALVLLKVLAK